MSARRRLGLKSCSEGKTGARATTWVNLPRRPFNLWRDTSRYASPFGNSEILTHEKAPPRCICADDRFAGRAAPGFAASSQSLPNLDRRRPAGSISLKAEQGVALGQLRERLASVQVDFDPLLQSPRRILAKDGFLTGPNAQGRAVAGGASLCWAQRSASCDENIPSGTPSPFWFWLGSAGCGCDQKRLHGRAQRVAHRHMGTTARWNSDLRSTVHFAHHETPRTGGALQPVHH